MRTRTLSLLFFVKTPRSSVNTALGLLVIGTIVSSLILVSFHYKSEYLLKQSDDREQNYEFGGPPGTGENGSVADSSFRRGNAAKAGMISASVSASASGSPRKGAMNNNNINNNNDDDNNINDYYTVETDTTNTVSATLRTTGSSNNKGGSHPANAKASVEHNGCLLHLNSRSWLESKRLGNQNISDSRIINNDYVAASILNIPLLLSDDEANSQSILKRTLCDKTSRFLTFKFSTTSLRDPNGRSHHTEGEGFSATETTTTTHIASNTSNHHHHDHDHRTLLHQLALRLTYLSVHAHQHKDAIREAEYRRKHSEVCDPELEAHRIGAFDFECPDARFLVVPMKRSGLGGQARLIAAVALMAGISSDRVVVFVNGSPVGPRFLREPWELSSCPRRDKQCFFLPDTPCVLTHDEIRNATTIGKAERRGLFKTGMLPEHLRDDRVLIMNMIDRPQREPPNFRRRIADTARKFLIDPLAGEHPNDPRLPLLSAAADHIVKNDDNENENDNENDNDNDNDDNDEKSIGDSFYYFGRNFRALHAMVFFALRPKLEYAERIDWILENTLESNHRSDLALGLPIRASDKCIIESECPPFETYVSLMQTVWDTHEKELGDAFRKRLGGGGTMPDSTTTVVDPPLLLQHTTNIILTSESPDVLEAQKAFQEQQSSGHHDEKKNLSFPFKFVTNRFDVLPNTGNPSELSDFEHDREEVLLSALASLKLQFHAKYTVGNCCSNHHLLLFDFLTGGCGAGNMDHHATCMQDHEDARFRLCCAWTKTEECLAKKLRRESLQSQQQQQQQQQQNTTVPP